MEQEIKMSLKDQYLLFLIPSLEKMIENANIHLEYLKMHNPKDYPMVDGFIESSNKFLEHLKQILEEYKQYAEKL